MTEPPTKDLGSVERLRREVERKRNPYTNPAGSTGLLLAVEDAEELLAELDALRAAVERILHTNWPDSHYEIARTALERHE